MFRFFIVAGVSGSVCPPMMCGLSAMAALPGGSRPASLPANKTPTKMVTITGKGDLQGSLTDLHGTISEELLVCKICYGRFAEDKLPKLLACSHTFCQPCIKKHYNACSDKSRWYRASKKWDFSCPLCRKTTALPGGGVEKLANNYTVMSLMEFMGAGSQVSSPVCSPDGSSGASASLIAEHCVHCQRRYPQSVYACGHCVCAQCNERVGGCSQCPQGQDAGSQVMEAAEAGDTPHQANVTPQAPTPEEDKSSVVSPSRQRPPPYNPLYVDNPLYGTSVSPRSTAEQHTQVSDQEIKATATPCSNGEAKQSAPPCSTGDAKPTPPLCSPSHQAAVSPIRRISHPLSETHLYRRLQQHLYDSSPSHGTDTHSSCYELPGHAYESPTSLRRTLSLRRPPVPPRRHSSSPGIFANLRLRRRSVSCPAQTKGNDVYQSPTELYGVVPPVPPPRRIYESPQSSPIRCVKKFGRYSEVRMQTSTFRQPTKVGVSEQGDIVVVDVQQMTVQVFTLAGDYLAMFKVIGVQGASFFSPDRLAVATHQGVDIYTMAGEKLKELHTGLTVNTVAFKFGFLAATPRSVLIYRQSLVIAKEITKRRTARPLLFRRTAHFENIKDVAVTTEKHIAVLDGSKAVIYLLDEDGIGRQTIDPALESCGRLRQPESLSLDRSNNIYVADTGNQRVLKFSHTGAYSKCLLNCRANPSERHLAPYGLAMTEHGHLVVVMSGEQTAEVRIYQIS